MVVLSTQYVQPYGYLLVRGTYAYLTYYYMRI
jgi:hypothetical protein